jgi:hypothetical protein
MGGEKFNFITHNFQKLLIYLLDYVSIYRAIINQVELIDYIKKRI